MTLLPHIVIVDNDLQIRGLLSSYLQSSGFQTTAMADSKALDRLLNSKRVDLIVLDPMLPGEDGLSICRWLRAEARVPVIIVTARRSELDRIRGLEIGAQDYIAKPFNPRELLARIKNVLGRWDAGAPRSTPRPERYRFANWTLDTISRCLIDPECSPPSIAASMCESAGSGGCSAMTRVNRPSSKRCMGRDM